LEAFVEVKSFACEHADSHPATRAVAISFPRYSGRTMSSCETMTRALTQALRERYGRVRHQRAKASVEELRAIIERGAAHVKRPYVDHAELLFDEGGLPK
jgi:antitoxin VapB